MDCEYKKDITFETKLISKNWVKMQDKWNEGNSFIYAPAMNFIILRILEGHIQKNIEWFWSGKDNLNQIFDTSFRPHIQSVDRN